MAEDLQAIVAGAHDTSGNAGLSIAFAYKAGAYAVAFCGAYLALYYVPQFVKGSVSLTAEALAIFGPIYVSGKLHRLARKFYTPPPPQSWLARAAYFIFW